MEHKLKHSLSALARWLPGGMRRGSYLRLKRTIDALDRAGSTQEAADLAVKSVEAYPRKPFFHYKAGKALARLGQERQACLHLSRALTLRPGHEGAVRQLLRVVSGSAAAASLAEEFSDSLAKACASTRDPAAIKRVLTAIAIADLERAGQVLAEHLRALGLRPEIAIGPIQGIEDWAKRTHAPLAVLGDIETIPYKLPPVYGSPPSSEVINGKSNRPYVANIPNARIFGKLDLILAEDGTVLCDEAAHPEFGAIVSYDYGKRSILRGHNRMLLDLTGYKTRAIRSAAFLSGGGSDSFGHWFPEYLPRIEYFRRHPDFAKLPIVISAAMPESHVEQLRRLADNELIRLGPDESLVCERLLVASSPTFLPVLLTVESLEPHSVPGMSPRALKFLQRELPRRPAAKPPFRRIFLARGNLGWRRLINETEIIEAMVKLGFEIVYTERMSAEMQIQLFQEAEWIVGPHGSALLNIIFASPTAKILVLSQPKLFNWGAFQGPMEVLGYRPLCVCAEYATDPDKKHSDYRLSLERLHGALEFMGLQRPK